MYICMQCGGGGNGGGVGSGVMEWVKHMVSPVVHEGTMYSLY